MSSVLPASAHSPGLALVCRLFGDSPKPLLAVCSDLLIQCTFTLEYLTNSSKLLQLLLM